jgi:hypothetical protein
MHASAHIDVSAQQQGNHHKRTVEAIGHDDVADVKRIEQLSQQRGFSGLLARIWTDRQVRDTRRGQGENRTRSNDLQTNTFLLRRRLRILGLIGGRVGHGKREAINELGVPPFPEPRGLGLLFEFLGDLDGKVVRSCSAASESLLRARQ